MALVAPADGRWWRAAALLYRAKHEGRDRATVGEPVTLPPLETGALVSPT
jgi:hypothetical protein